MPTNEIQTLLEEGVTLNGMTYILILGTSLISGFFVSYIKEKGKNYATKEDFTALKKQLKQNTSLVEGIKIKLSNKSWISQQVWVKKQEAYEDVFEQLFHIKRFVFHRAADYQEYDNIHGDHVMNHVSQSGEGGYERWEKEKKEYEKKANDPKTKKEAQEIKTSYEKALSSALQTIEVKSIYLDSNVEKAFKKLKSELSATHEDEEYDDHFIRITKETNNAIQEIRDISMAELKMKN